MGVEVVGRPIETEIGLEFVGLGRRWSGCAVDVVPGEVVFAIEGCDGVGATMVVRKCLLNFREELERPSYSEQG